jgi:hypothetical protein
MEAFLQHVLLVLPAIGINSFSSGKRSSAPVIENAPTDTDAPVFCLRSPRHGLSAEAHLIDGEFVVQKGSDARSEWSSIDQTHTYAHLFNELVAAGVLVERDDKRTFTQNYAFKKPSAAAAMVIGRPSNGRQEWKLKETGQAYAYYEQDRLAEIENNADVEA